MESVVPNPKLKLLDPMREVMRLKHYSIRTERTYGDWVRRFVRFHRMRTREGLLPAEPKIEAFLSEVAVKGGGGGFIGNGSFHRCIHLDRQRAAAFGGLHDPQFSAPFSASSSSCLRRQ